MRKIMILSIVVGTLIACNQDQYMTYEDVSRLQFGPTPDKIYTQQSEWEDTLKTFTFLSVAADKMQDTVYFDIYSIGPLSSVERRYELEQVFLDNTDNAVPGIHYQSFDDPEISRLYVIPANCAHTVVPVIVLRDSSLETREYVLKFKIKENEHFQLGDSGKKWRKLILSDVLLKPTLWLDGHFGTYSRVKHRFMMENTGMKWDDEYFASIRSDVSMGYYWQSKFQKLLYNYNHDPENEDTPLMDENGREVKFSI